MTTTDRSAGSVSPTPSFSVWSPPVAVVGALVAQSSPGWVTALVWGLAVLSALPFTRFRLVVPLALTVWVAGWLASFVLRLVESGVVGLFLR
jgi:hypothetical protein